MPLDVTHTGPVSLTQVQSDLVWEVLEANHRVVSLLRGDHLLVTRECQPPRGGETGVTPSGNHGIALPSVLGRSL